MVIQKEMIKMKIIGKYSEKVKQVLTDFEPTRTKQSQKDECDINNILKKYKRTGVISAKIKENPLYGDYSTVTDFRDSVEIILKAQNQFDALPSHIRERFANSPEKFLVFCHDEKNVDEMVKLGLATKKTTINDETQVADQTASQTNTSTVGQN